MMREAVESRVAPQKYLGPIRHMFVPEGARAHGLYHGPVTQTGSFIFYLNRDAVSVTLDEPGLQGLTQWSQAKNLYGFSQQGLQVRPKVLLAQVMHERISFHAHTTILPPAFTRRLKRLVSYLMEKAGGLIPSWRH
jgi:hypothetical protein